MRIFCSILSPPFFVKITHWAFNSLLGGRDRNFLFELCCVLLNSLITIIYSNIPPPPPPLWESDLFHGIMSHCTEPPPPTRWSEPHDVFFGGCDKNKKNLSQLSAQRQTSGDSSLPAGTAIKFEIVSSKVKNVFVLERGSFLWRRHSWCPNWQIQHQENKNTCFSNPNIKTGQIFAVWLQRNTSLNH